MFKKISFIILLISGYSSYSKTYNLLNDSDSSNLRTNKKFIVSLQLIKPQGFSNNEFIGKIFPIGNSILYKVGKKLQIGINTRFHYGYSFRYAQLGTDSEKYKRQVSIKLSPELRYTFLKRKISPFVSIRYPALSNNFNWRSETKPVKYHDFHGDFMYDFFSLSLGIASNFSNKINYFMMLNAEYTKTKGYNRNEFGVGINFKAF